MVQDGDHGPSDQGPHQRQASCAPFVRGEHDVSLRPEREQLLVDVAQFSPGQYDEATQETELVWLAKGCESHPMAESCEPVNPPRGLTRHRTRVGESPHLAERVVVERYEVQRQSAR